VGRGTGRAPPEGLWGQRRTTGSGQRPQGDWTLTGWCIYARPKATRELQIFDFATGRPGLEACQSMLPPA
jgi:hypothetical protein